MAETTMLFAMKNIDELLIQHVGFLHGLDHVQDVGCSFNLCTSVFSNDSFRSGSSYFDVMKCLNDELQRMQLFIKDAVEKQDNNERIRNWISDVRDVSREADDVTDALVLKAIEAARTSVGFSGELKPIGKQIEDIRAKIRDVERRRERYKIHEDGSGKGMEWCLRPQISRRQKDKQLVGMDEDVEFLVEKLIWEESGGLSIASIVGTSGIGKSTLARIVYDNALAAERFDRCVWLAVSGEYTPKDVIKELMLQLLHPRHDKRKEAESLEELPLSGIQELLHRSLRDARLFLVVDNVGQDAQWESIATAFTIDEDKGSRLLLTSRNEGIAKDAGGYVHKMKTLDSDKSWELFTNKVLTNNVDGKLPEDLEIIGR